MDLHGFAGQRIDETKLEDIAPDSIKTDEVLAFFRAFDPELQEINAAVCEAFIMVAIDTLPEPVVDLLAWQLHVDFYEPLGLSLDKKRALVKNSLIWHRLKGTRYVLEDMIRILFFDNFKIEEWFEYGGEPYFFRLESNDSLTNMEQHGDLIRAIHELKNERSWLEGIRFNRNTEMSIQIGIVGKRTRRFEVDGHAPESDIADTSVNFGMIGKRTRRFEIHGSLMDTTITSPSMSYAGIAGKRVRHYTIGAEDTSEKESIANVLGGFAAKRTRRFEIDASIMYEDSEEG